MYFEESGRASKDGIKGECSVQYFACSAELIFLVYYFSILVPLKFVHCPQLMEGTFKLFDLLVLYMVVLSLGNLMSSHIALYHGAFFEREFSSWPYIHIEYCGQGLQKRSHQFIHNQSKVLKQRKWLCFSFRTMRQKVI